MAAAARDLRDRGRGSLRFSLLHSLSVSGEVGAVCF